MPGSGPASNLHVHIPPDVFGYTTGYWRNDYLAIGRGDTGFEPFEADINPAGGGSDLDAAAPGLFDGNIRHVVTAVAKRMEGGQPPWGTACRYDQLERLLKTDLFTNIDLTNNRWGSGGAPRTDYLMR